MGVPSAHAVGGTISGVVRDTSGAPIGGATVFTQVQQNAFNFPNFSAITDASGNYTITGLGPASWKVAAYASGFAVRWGNASTFDSGASVGITGEESQQFDVVLPRKTASISGTMTDPSGNPVVGASINLVNRGGLLPSFLPGFESAGYFGFGTTDAAGHYVISNLAPSPFTVNFSAVGFAGGLPPEPTPFLDEWYPDQRTESTAARIELVEGQETPGIDAQLDLGATISGRVIDQDGNPVVGAGVNSSSSVFGPGAVTDALGTYTLIGIPPGSLAFVVADSSDPRFLPGFYGGANFDSATAIPVGLGQVITGIDIVLPTAGLVNYAIFSPDGSPASGGIVPCIDPGVPVVLPPQAPGFGPQLKCTSGGTVISAFAGGGLRIPIGTYNAVGAEGIGTFGVTTLNPSDVAHFTLTADTPVDCLFNLGGAASCVATDPATNDGDGIPAIVEDGAPNNGDGNNDGVRDAVQSNVASRPAAIGGGYVTLVVAADLRITTANVSSQSGVPQPLETGAITVGVAGLSVGGTADITVLRSNGGAATELWALSQKVVNYAPVPAEFDGTTITAHIVDGGEFDSNGGPGPFFSFPDGFVQLSMTPVIPDRTPPVITCPTPEPVFAVQQFATITATVTDSGSGVLIPTTFPPPFPGRPPFSQDVNTFAPGSGSVTFTASDKAGNTATATCRYTIVDDGDGVPPFLETGDGNGDGVPDAIQPNVATAGTAFSGAEPIVVASPAGTQLTALDLQSSFFFTPPPGDVFESGLVSATVTGVAAGSTIDLDLYQRAARGTGFVQFPFFGAATSVPASFAGPRVTLSVTDGGSGDIDGIVNGSIVLRGAVVTGETTPPVITCGARPTFFQDQQFAPVTATVFDAGSGVPSPFLSLIADTSTPGTFSVTFVASDFAGNQATQSCDYVVAEGDGDGVATQVEDAAPNNGDGNGDGVRDGAQSNVASLPQPIGAGYATIVSIFGNALTDVSATDFADTPPVPAAFRLESGLYRFTVQSSFAAISLIRSTGSFAPSFVSPVNGTWQQISSFVFDGGFGDADGQFNGRVSFVVAPASIDFNPPTITCPASPSWVLNQPGAALTASVVDNESGVASGAVTVPVSTTTVGFNSVSVSASDNAGNLATVQCFYNVGVKLDRMTKPNPRVTNAAKAGRPIPVRWRAVDFNGAPVSDPNHFLGVTATSSACVKQHKENLDAVAQRGLRYLGDGRWEFDWTSPAHKGCYLLRLDLVGASATGRLLVK